MSRRDPRRGTWSPRREGAAAGWSDVQGDRPDRHAGRAGAAEPPGPPGAAASPSGSLNSRSHDLTPRRPGGKTPRQELRSTQGERRSPNQGRPAFSRPAGRTVLRDDESMEITSRTRTVVGLLMLAALALLGVLSVNAVT